jgi:peptidoglycan L-alanyl-D-glutamate endopeptidase CwlK
MASRKIEDLTPEMQIAFSMFKEKMDEAGISFIVTCTARSVKEQYALYAQGRQPLEEVNALRKMAGLWLISEKENKRKVTWTLRSKHLVDLDDGSADNDKSQAFDIVITKDKKAQWDIKVDVNDNDIPDYLEAGRIGESIGLRWGGRFKSPDRPHFEYMGAIA